MKLVLIIPSLDSGGAERVLTQLATYFADEKGHDVHIVLLRAEGAKSFYPLSPNVTLHYVGNIKPVKRRDLVWAVKTAKRFWEMRQMIKALSPDRIISFIEIMNVVTLLITRGLRKNGKKIPVIISERTDPFFFKIPYFLEVLRKLTYPWSQKIVTQREGVKVYFSNKIQKLMITIPNMVPSFPSDMAIEKQPLILSIGRLDEGKAHHILIKAFAKIAPHYPHWFMEIYGEGVERDNLEALITDLNLEKQVKLPGRTQEVPQKLAGASIFAFPTLFEGFSNALAEAMAAGLPVIASDCEGNLALVETEKNGLLVKRQDIEGMAQALKILMDSPKRRSQLGNAAQKSMTQFSPDKIMKQWDKLL